MNVEDIASKISYLWYTAWLKRPNFWVHVSPCSAETLARGGGITNHHLIVYSLSNISAKSYQNRLMCVEVIVCYIIVVFWDTVYIGYISLVPKFIFPSPQNMGARRRIQWREMKPVVTRDGDIAVRMRAFVSPENHAYTRDITHCTVSLFARQDESNYSALDCDVGIL